MTLEPDLTDPADGDEHVPHCEACHEVVTALGRDTHRCARPLRSGLVDMTADILAMMRVNQERARRVLYLTQDDFALANDR